VKRNVLSKTAKLRAPKWNKQYISVWKYVPRNIYS